MNEHRATGRICLTTALLLLLSVAQLVLSNLKDSVILVYHPDGVLAVAAVQVWGLLPGSIAVSALFAWLSSRLGYLRASYVTLGGFLGYYLLFAFVLFPYRETFQLEAVGRWLEYAVPVFGRSVACCLEHWVVCGFYVMCDIWASAVIAVIFWGFVNTRTATHHAERQYGFLKIGATASALVAGLVASGLVQQVYDPALGFGSTAWEQTLIMQVLLVTGLGIASLLILKALAGAGAGDGVSSGGGARTHIGLRQSVTTLVKNRYLGGIAMGVVGYAVVFIMSDLVWKHHLRLVYPDPNDLMTHLNRMLWGIGGISVVGALCSGWLLRRFGWTFVAATTPYVIAVTGMGLFTLVFWGEEVVALCPSGWGMSSTWMVVYAGTLHMVLLKALKFSVFDVSKELAFTPLETSVQWQGKVAIDGVGYYVGKTGTALLQQTAIAVLGGVMASTAFMGSVVFAMLIGWIMSVHRVGHDYNLSTRGDGSPVPIRT